MDVTFSEVKAFIKFSIFIKNILTKLPTFWMLKSLFGPLIGRKKVLYISLPSIYLRCPNDNVVQPYRRRGSMPGSVRIDLPWIRPHDSNAASNIKLLFSDFVQEIKIVPDEDIDNKMIRENLVCIGGQSNWIFEQFVMTNNYILPLEYRIDQNKKKDGFYNSMINKSYESDDKNYLYGLLAIIRNPHSYNKRIVFASGLDADATLEITRALKDNLIEIYRKAKSIKHRRSGFYCICRFKRTGDRKTPLIYDDVFVNNISVKNRA